MFFYLQQSLNKLYKGLFLVIGLSIFSLFLSELSFFKNLHISSLTLAIIIGIIFGNTYYQKLSLSLSTGINFCTKKLLRLGIILYGFRVTFQQIFDTGIKALMFDLFVVSSIIILGYIIGKYYFKLNTNTSLLVSSGSAICGAAAVLAVESTIKAQPHETAVSIATVVIFGTIAMFVFPYLVKMMPMTNNQIGIALGATVHEVAQVVAAGNMVNPTVEQTAVIVKLTRVMILVPFLIIISFFVSRSGASIKSEKKSLFSMIPWFALGFILMSGFHSLDIFNLKTIEYINVFDTFILTMAMTALGIESNFNKMKQVGLAPFLLAGTLFFILMLYLLVPQFF